MLLRRPAAIDRHDGAGGWKAGIRTNAVAPGVIGRRHRDNAGELCNGSAMLADAVSMSISEFSAGFGQLVGDGSIAYLTRWRILLAGRELSRGKSIGAVARSGYESGSAFSTAFKRVTCATS
jgi:AraC-like DNA-binding protein